MEVMLLEIIHIQIAGYIPIILQQLMVGYVNTELFVEQLDVVASQSANSLIANSLGGTAPYNYSWSNGQAGQSITVSENGIYCDC